MIKILCAQYTVKAQDLRVSIIKPLEGWLIGLGANVKQLYITETAVLRFL